MAALPPQPPGSQPPQPPSVSPPSGPPSGPPGGPPVPSYPSAAYAPQMPPQAYPVQSAAVAPVKVHKRTFFLTIAQFFIILLAIVRILLGIAAIGAGVFILVDGSSHLATLPGYDQYVKQFGDAVVNLAATFFFIAGAPFLISGIVDLILGIIVGRPSNIARWFIIILDVLSILYVIDILAHNDLGGLWTLGFVIYLAIKVIVFYALALDPPTRRNFAGKAF